MERLLKRQRRSPGQLLARRSGEGLLHLMMNEPSKTAAVVFIEQAHGGS
jgi:hypothetical protein